MARKARIVTINDKPYRFSKFEMELIESHGITAGMVSKRVKTVGNYMKQWTTRRYAFKRVQRKKTIERLEQARLERKLEESKRKRLS